MEDHLTEREYQLEIALETARLGSWTLDLTNGTIECSAQCLEDFGIAEGGTLTDQRLRELIDPANGLSLRAAIDQAARSRVDFEAEYPINRQDGNRSLIRVSGRALHKASGTPERMMGVTIDLTPRNPQAAAKQGQDSLSLTDAAAVGAWDWDIVADRVYANARFAQLFSIDPQRVANGAPIADFLHSIHPEDRDCVEQAIARAVDTGAEFAEEYRLVQADNSIRWVYAIGRCLKDESGVPCRFPGVIFDTTERKLEGKRIQESQIRCRRFSTAPTNTSGCSRRREMCWKRTARRLNSATSHESTSLESLFGKDRGFS